MGSGEQPGLSADDAYRVVKAPIAVAGRDHIEDDRKFESCTVSGLLVFRRPRSIRHSDCPHRAPAAVLTVAYKFIVNELTNFFFFGRVFLTSYFFVFTHISYASPIGSCPNNLSIKYPPFFLSSLHISLFYWICLKAYYGYF